MRSDRSAKKRKPRKDARSPSRSRRTSKKTKSRRDNSGPFQESFLDTLNFGPPKTDEDCFKDQVQFSLHLAMDPSCSDKNDCWDIALHKLDRRVQSVATSVNHSARWTPVFGNTLRARPEMASCQLADDEDTQGTDCQTCHKSHARAYKVWFSGETYHSDTLEDRSANNGRAPKSSRCSQINAPTTPQAHVAPAGKVFYVGSTCYEKAVRAHKLYHWRWALFRLVRDKLSQERRLTDERISLRTSMSPEERCQEIESILEEWRLGLFLVQRFGAHKRLWKL
jgi:hypothetical protein